MYVNGRSSRRSFLARAAFAAAIAPDSQADNPRISLDGAESEVVPLNGVWSFRLDPRQEGDSAHWQTPETSIAGWRDVSVPHTWQIEQENSEYRGVAWYRRTFDAAMEWKECAVRIEFEAVFHSAVVYLNGIEIGKHTGKGYTAFAFLTDRALRYGALNTVVVRADNTFSDSMLPRMRSSDWAHDGGIYRPVQLLVTQKVFIEQLAIDAEPDLAAKTAVVSISATLRNASGKTFNGSLAYRIADAQTGNSTLQVTDAAPISLAPDETKTVALRGAPMSDVKLWHFDEPNLYNARVFVAGGHALEHAFGVRKIEIRNTAFYLNGEKVRLMGVERMAGSNPEFGMAEPREWIEHDHSDLKNLNCVYTRVHWPQDRAVLDWCDRHGILIQTEVPAWGPNTFSGMGAEPAEAIMANGLEQLREMIARDRNHPCIFSWGVCNEINGQNPPAFAFARRMHEEAKRLDPKRLVSYASHSLFDSPAKDVTSVMDYVMFNEYIGSWKKGTPADLAGYLDEIHKAFPNKPVVISEYGYCACTADRPEADDKREAVLISHDEEFRHRDYVAGLIFFCYNDYRTHVGDRGRGVLQQRVHGVVDVYGDRKHSYDALRVESSPLENLNVTNAQGAATIRIKSRQSVPAYTLRGYKLRALIYGQGNIAVERYEIVLADLAPGEEVSHTVKYFDPQPLQIRVDLMRPTGFSAHTATWHESR